jgi:two-component system, sensor histidine kinase
MTTKCRQVAQCPLTTESDLLIVRNTTKQLAVILGLSSPDQTRLVTAVSEVARNALLYAGGGKVNFELSEQIDNEFLQITVIDSGPGIANVGTILNLEAAVVSGANTSLTAVRRLVDYLEITTGESGTAVSLRKGLIGTALSRRDLEKWAQAFPPSAPDLILQELQQQNRDLVAALDEVQKVRAELEERSTQLTHANQLKAQFLANVSHEIRTPMNAVLGLTNILDKRLEDQEDRRLIGLLRQSASSLLNIINDILDLSKIDEGKLLISNQVFSLVNLIDDVANMFAAQAASREIVLVVSLDPTLPQFVLSDENRIRQILVNLVGNAIKFSEHGEIKINTFLSWKNQNRVGVRIEVQDQGIGIESGDLDKLFKPFSQIDGTWNRRQTGTGLGLSICKRLAELLDGTIGVNSAVGVGSTFWIELPFDSMDEQAAAKQDLPEIYSFPGAKILLGEDHPVNQMVAINVLEGLAVEVGVASDGLEVLAQLNSTYYDLILLDCQMPMMDGFETTAAIRQMESGSARHIPIVAMTANAMAGDREHCLSMGMDDYISKPFEERDLAGVLAKWLNIDQNQSKKNSNNDSDQLAVSNDPGQAIVNVEPNRAANVEPGQSAANIDAVGLFERFKKQQVKQLLQAFLDDSEIRLPKMKAAIEKNDLQVVGKEAHAIKGACSLIFMARLSLICSGLEAAAKQQNSAQVNAHFASLMLQYERAKEETLQLLAQIEK